jgi:hypothetical protein
MRLGFDGETIVSTFKTHLRLRGNVLFDSYDVLGAIQTIRDTFLTAFLTLPPVSFCDISP